MTPETQYWMSLIMIMAGCSALGFVVGVGMMSSYAKNEINRLRNGYGTNKFVECRPRSADILESEVIGDA